MKKGMFPYKLLSAESYGTEGTDWVSPCNRKWFETRKVGLRGQISRPKLLEGATTERLGVRIPE